MDHVSQQTIYRSVIIAKLTYASSEWWRCTSATDRQWLEAFIRRSDRSRFVPANLSTFAELCFAADEKLFKTVIRDNNHVLHKFLPPRSEAFEHHDRRRKRELTFTFAICCRPSVCRLSSVTLVHPPQAVEIFGNISTAFGTVATQ